MAQAAAEKRDITARLLRRAGAVMLGLAGLVLLLVALAIALLNIRPVRQALLDVGLAQANNAGLALSVEDISGNWPSTLILENVSLRDDKGTWLTLPHASIEWRPLALWSGEVHIVALTVTGLDVDRAPESGAPAEEPASDTPFTLPRLPSLPVAIRIDALTLDGARLGKALAGSDTRLNASGDLHWKGTDIDLNLRADRTDNVPGHIVAHIAHDAGSGRGDLTLDVTDGSSAKPGLVAALTEDPRFAGVTAKASGTMREGAMTGEMSVTAGRAIDARLAAHGLTGDETDITLSLDAQGRMIADAMEPVGARTVKAETRIGWDGARRLSLREIDVTAGALALTGDIETAGAAKGGVADIKGSGTIRGLDKLAGADGNSFLDAMDWRLAAKADMDRMQADIGEFALASQDNELRFAGQVALADGLSVDGEAHGALADLKPIGELAGQPLAGQVKLDIAPLTLDPDGAAHAQLSLAGEKISTGDPMLDGLLSPGFTAAAALSMDGRGGYAASGLDARSANFSLTGTGSMTATGALKGDATLSMPDAGKVLGSMNTRGKLSAQVALSGTSAAPQLSLEAKLQKGMLAGLDAKLASLTAKIGAGDRQDGGSQGPIAFRLNGDDGQIRLDTKLALPEKGGATLDPIDASILGAPLKGSLSVDADGLASGSLTGENLALAPLAALAGLPIDGQADIDFALDTRNGKQNATAYILVPRLIADVSSRLTLEKAEVALRADDLAGDPSLDVVMKTRSGGAGNTRFSAFGATASGPLDNIAFDVEVKGEREQLKPAGLSFLANGAYTGDGVSLDALDYVVGAAEMHLTRPFTIKLGETIKTDKLLLDTDSTEGKGSITAQMDLRARAAYLDATIDNAPLELLTPVLPVEAARGSASGTVALDSGKSSAEIALDFKDVRVPEANLEERPAFDASLDGKWAGRKLTLSAWAKGVSTEPFKLDATLPLIRDPQGAFPMLPERGPVSGKLTWEGPLGSLAALADLDGQKIDGATDVLLTVSGDISAPLVNGTVDITDGRFENISTGTVLRDMRFHMEAQNSRAFTFRLDADDGGKGRMKAEGNLTLGKGAKTPLLVKLDFDKAHLVRQAEADAAVSGDLTIEAKSLPPTPEAPLSVSGKLTTDLAQYRIPQSLPASVPEIQVTEINAPAGIVQREKEEAPLPTALDLTVEIGQPALVTGRGVNALWQGSLHITGTADAPRISGSLTSLRGSLDFAGKTFTLKKGVITFYGRNPPNPTIDVALGYQRNDFEATISVTGQASDPEIDLSSPSGLPEDEVISRILFDKQVGELSAFEAAQLAATAAELSGVTGGGGLSVLGQIQQQLGLDVLRVNQGASGQTTVSAGKYIDKGIYVGVEQGALASDSSVKVEIDVTDNISVETSVGQDASGGAGVNWKWDY